MPDGAVSVDPAVQAQLDRLFAHGPGTDTLGLDRITRLLARLSDPHRALPPVFHVAGTNGKGSTCAFLRAALEAAGHRVHVYTSPHLVRFNERIRLAGRLIDDAALAPLLAEVLDVAADLNASFFEVTTAAAFLAFARTPADACVIEVGLGGRLDATNVIERPAVCGIAALGIDHQAFLGDTLEQIAAEKAGIAKAGVPLVTMNYPPAINDRVHAVAWAIGTVPLVESYSWRWSHGPGGLNYTDTATLHLPAPLLPGAHQAANFALAVAMLRHQQVVTVTEDALAAAARDARWPARMQRLGDGPLTRSAGRAIWIDGAHNHEAAAEVAQSLPNTIGALIVGILANKDAVGILAPLIATGIDKVVAVPVPGHAFHAPTELAAFAALHHARWTATASTLPEALAAIGSASGETLIAGSLYLAGEALRLNNEVPE